MLTVGSKKFEHECRMIYAGFPSFFGLALQEGHASVFRLLLQVWRVVGT